MIPGGIPRVDKLFDIIYEDRELLVINKPAGLVCHPTKTDEYSSLISRARLHLGLLSPGGGARSIALPVPETNSPGAEQCLAPRVPQPQLVNRLDRETSGVTLVAKDPATARELRRIWENRQVQKDYVAIGTRARARRTRGH